jgi:hypothetical protein
LGEDAPAERLQEGQGETNPGGAQEVAPGSHGSWEAGDGHWKVRRDENPRRERGQRAAGPAHCTPD